MLQTKQLEMMKRQRDLPVFWCKFQKTGLMHNSLNVVDGLVCGITSLSGSAI